jgi:hypothetical protein
LAAFPHIYGHGIPAEWGVNLGLKFHSATAGTAPAGAAGPNHGYEGLVRPNRNLGRVGGVVGHSVLCRDIRAIVRIKDEGLCERMLLRSWYAIDWHQHFRSAGLCGYGRNQNGSYGEKFG